MTIFAAGFGHGSGREERLHDRQLARSEVVDGVRLVWLRTFPYHGNTWRRMVNMASYAIVAPVAQAGRPRPELVIGSTVHPFAAFAAWCVARLHRARFIFEIRDLWPQTLIDLGAMRAGSPGARLLATLEGFLVRQAEAVIALLPGVKTYLDERGLPSGHVRYLPNGVDLSTYAGARTSETCPEPPRSLVADLASRRGQGQVVLAYTGSFGRVNRLDVVIRALAIASHQLPGRLALVLVGDGPDQARLVAVTHELGLRNVIFADPSPKT